MNIVLNKIRQNEYQNRYAFGFGDLKNKVKNLFNKNKDEEKDSNQAIKDFINQLPNNWKKVIDIPDGQTIQHISVCDTYTVYSPKHFCLTNRVGDTNTSDTIVLPYLSSDFPQGANPFDNDNMDKKDEETTTGKLKVEVYINSESGFEDLKDINMNIIGIFDMDSPYQFYKEFTVDKSNGIDQVKNAIEQYKQSSDNLLSSNWFEKITNWVADEAKTNPNDSNYVFDNDVFSNTCGLKTKYNTTKEIERV